jgi:hypothetical protein
MKVWIIERNHEPIKGNPFFSDTPAGLGLVKYCLNRYEKKKDGHYYDAVLYEGPEGKAVPVKVQ